MPSFSSSISIVPFLLLTATLTYLSCHVVADEEVDYYAILELDAKEDSTDKDIKRQFRVLSKQWHPDHNPSEEARQRYQKIQRAHEVLSDKKKRKMYDMKGEQGLKQLEQPNNQGDHDPFAGFFGGGHQQQGNKGQNMQMNLQVPLEDVYRGNTHPIKIQKQKLCRACKGSGAASKSDMKVCPQCKGEGVVTQKINLGGMFIQQVQSQCPQCGGKGKTVKKKCLTCHGNKVFRGEDTLDVEIERGIPEEHRITFEMEADQNPDQIPGDVLFVIKSAPHTRFKRKGNDLHYTLRVTLLEALVGFTRRIEHLDDHVVTVERNVVTPFGTVITMENEGMPIHNVPSERGSLYVTVEVDFPSRIRSEHADSLRSLLKEVGGDW
jgi:DnaJ-class molecular chaperone